MASHQFFDQIDQDDLPSMAWGSIGHVLPCQRSWEALHPIAQVTTFNVLCHIATNPWPPEVAGVKFCHFP